MDNLSVALKHVSCAVNFDSNGFQQAAFSKYIQSLQVLIVYLNNIFVSSGFEKILEKKKEIMQILSMVHECSDRIAVILNDHEKVDFPAPDLRQSHGACAENKLFNSKVSAFEKIQSDNMQLFKVYKSRLERANDKLTKSNLNLEFQRRVSENAILAKKKYDAALKQLQKERLQFMEEAIRKLFENGEQLNEKEREKRDLYNRVLQYVKTEMWPCSWKLNSFDLTAYEMTEKIFQKIISCYEHPLTQWLLLVQTNIRRKIDAALKQHHEYIPFLPDLNSDSELKYYSVQEHCDCVVIKLSSSESAIAIPVSKMDHLENTVEAISAEIRSVIGDTLEIFYLIYKSLLPDESETVCYHVIEKYILKPLWFNLSLIFRVLNLPSECKLSESMCLNWNCEPSQFEVGSSVNIPQRLCENLAAMLRTISHQESLVYKLKTLVKVSQQIGDCTTVENGYERKLGADEMLPLLSYVIVQSRVPHLISECNMLELLFDMKYMLGEEGYALSSFLASLKCIEIMKLTESSGDKN